jgi:hypothetical protein
MDLRERWYESGRDESNRGMIRERPSGKRYFTNHRPNNMESVGISGHPTPAVDWLIAPICEGLIILVVGLIGLLTKNPLIFSSLGATGFEQIEKSRSASARPYNIVVGHMVGVVSGFAAVAMLGIWNDPVVLSSHQLSAGRVWGAALAVVLTVAINQQLRATQPAACSTSLLVALGSFNNWHHVAFVLGGVLVITAVGEPLRRLRIRSTGPEKLH